MERSDMMDTKQFQSLMEELKVIKKLLIANLYASGLDSKDLDKIIGMGDANIRKLLSRKKIKKVSE